MAEPLTTAELKAQLRKTTTDEDALIDDFGAAAREWLEDYTGHILVEREVTDTFSAWGDYLTLRHQPITVDDPTPTLTVTYENSEGSPTVYASRVIRDQRYPWTIYPPYGGSFPTLADNGTISVTYTAGYNDDNPVPERLRLAIRVLTADMQQNRSTAPSEECLRAIRHLVRAFRGAVMA